MTTTNSINASAFSCLLAAAVLVGVAGCSRGPAAVDTSGPTASWPEYGGDKGGLRYSPLTQITRENVNDLRVAWTYHSGDFSNGSAQESKTSLSVTPIIADDLLVLCTGLNRVIALDPGTGAERWAFDPKVRNRKLEGPYTRVCRGVAY